MFTEGTAHVPYSVESHPRQSSTLYIQYTPQYTPVPPRHTMAQPNHLSTSHSFTLLILILQIMFGLKTEIERGFARKLDKLISLVENLTDRVEALEKRPSEPESEYI